MSAPFSVISPLPNAPSWPQTLIDMLERQHALIDGLDGLADQQQSLIADGRADALLELLGRRQGVIDEFTSTQGPLSELTRDIDARLHAANPDQRARIRSLIDTIGARLAAVMARDERDQAALSSSRIEVQRELASLGAARQARAAYVGLTPSASPRYADRRG